MNKKMNTVLFMIGGTILNIILMLVIFFILILFANLVLNPGSDPKLKMLFFIFILGASVIGTFFIYSKIVKLISKKWNLEEHMHPLFGTNKKNRLN